MCQSVEARSTNSSLMTWDYLDVMYHVTIVLTRGRAKGRAREMGPGSTGLDVGSTLDIVLAVSLCWVIGQIWDP